MAERVGVALGQVTQMCIHFGRVLGLSLKNMMVFNGAHSRIYSKEAIEKKQQPNKFFVQQRTDNLSFT